MLKTILKTENEKKLMNCHNVGHKKLHVCMQAHPKETKIFVAIQIVSLILLAYAVASLMHAVSSLAVCSPVVELLLPAHGIKQSYYIHINFMLLWHAYDIYLLGQANLIISFSSNVL